MPARVPHVTEKGYISLTAIVLILGTSMSVTTRVSKTGMSRVEGENSRLRHYLARLHRKTLCYSKSVDMLLYKSVRLLIYSLKHGRIPLFC